MLMIFNRKFFHIFLLSLVLSTEVIAKVPVGNPIIYSVGYNEFCKIGANWSSTSKCNDYSYEYAVVTWSDYADDIHDFVKEYPTVTIETSGYAYSNETVGDVGRGLFGRREFDTKNFNNINYIEKFIVGTDSNAFWWHVVMEIGFGFKSKENKFYLRPFLHGWIYSGGAVWRYAHYGQIVTTITFNPKPTEEYSVILVT